MIMQKFFWHLDIAGQQVSVTEKKERNCQTTRYLLVLQSKTL